MSKTKNAFVMIAVLLAAGTVGWHCVPDDLSKEANVAYDYSENDALEGTTPRHWRVIWHENPATEATIAWSTRDNASSTLYWDSQSRSGVTTAYANSTIANSAKFTTGDDDIHNHVVELTNLTANTEYWFTMETGTSTSREFWFKTAPDTDLNFKFLYGGDSRSQRGNRRKMNVLVRNLAKADAQIICLVHGGDYIFDGHSWNEWAEWLIDHELLTQRDGQILPIVPARGNHEASGPLFDEIWNTPGNSGDNYWVTALSPQFRITNLNSNIAHGGSQKTFLEAELTANTTVRWQTANYHRPAYPAYKQPGDALIHWVPVFEAYDVDVVFESDGHTFKRTVPIRNGAKATDGVVYIGEGGLGVSQRTPDGGRWYFQNGGNVGSFLHVQKVSVTSTQLTVETIDIDKAVRDSWSRAPRVR